MSNWRECVACETPNQCKSYAECRDSDGHDLDGIPWHAQKLCGCKVNVDEMAEFIRTGIVTPRIMRKHRKPDPWE